MKSLLLAAAAAWFAYHALTFAVPDPSGSVSEGEAVLASALQSGMRILCAGLAVVSLAQIEWHRAEGVLDRLPFGDKPAPPRQEW